MNTVRIVAAIVDTRSLTMYQSDGKKIIIPQGDPRLRRLVDEVVPQIDTQGFADVELIKLEENAYASMEEKTNGLVKFFRVAKSALKALLNPVDEPVEPVVAGTVPLATDQQDEQFDPVTTEQPKKATQSMSAVNEILAHAIPVASAEFSEVGIEKQRVIAIDGETSGDHPSDEAKDTIIAVVDNKIIPNMERIKSQFNRAIQGSSIGMENFLKRLATVIEHRSHSVDDLLRFLERADLPIADDGSIIIYKVLRFGRKERTHQVYVDCHTGKVEQFIGAYVCMDPSLVDRNRNNECSNGLHVARRGYIKGFRGNVCVLAKLAPEDVITVPSYDANKMRVCGYHILLELSEKQYGLLRENRPITDDPLAKSVLAAVMRGEHVSKTHEVRIRGNKGEDVITTKLEQDTGPILAPQPDAVMEAEALADDPNHIIAPPIDPKTVVEEVKQQFSRREQAQQLKEMWEAAKRSKSQAEQDVALAALLAFKKTAKVSWEKLGIPDPERPELPVAKGKPITVKNPPASVIPLVAAIGNEGSPRERIAKLLAIGLDAQGIAQKVYDIKKASKKNWEVLGVKPAQMKKILKLLGKN